MLMVIFGAGASYDSAQAYPVAKGDGGPWRPPLAKDLFLDRHQEFGDIIRKYAKLTHILPYLREPSSGQTVEEVLESFQDEAENILETRRELAAVRFYLCELLFSVTAHWSVKTNGVTNYAPLIRSVLQFTRSDELVCLVTFNYDSLLENALHSFGFASKPPEEHLTSHPTLKLFNLHGSVNWSRLIAKPQAVPHSVSLLIDQADAVELSDTFVLGRAQVLLETQIKHLAVFPAIAIPVQTKTADSFECPRSHLDELARIVPQVTKILIIGWQGREEHFLGILRRKLRALRSIMVVGRDKHDSGEILVRFLTDVRKTDIGRRFLGAGGFTHFIVNREGDRFFEAK